MSDDTESLRAPDITVEAAGDVTPPQGMTQEEADRLAAEADSKENPPS